MSTDGAVEEIFLGTGEAADAGPRQTDRIFRQVSRLKGHRATYEIFNGRFLQVHIRGRHTKPRRYTVDLAFLCAQPVRRVTVAWRLLGVAFVAAIITVLLAAYFYHTNKPLVLNPWLPVVVVTGTVAAVVGLLGLHRCSDRLLFHSEHGETVFLELLNNGQKNKEFRSFVDDIARCIEQTRAQRYKGDSPAFLVDELREHRRLKDEAVIDERAYESARTRILQRHGAAEKR